MIDNFRNVLLKIFINTKKIYDQKFNTTECVGGSLIVIYLPLRKPVSIFGFWSENNLLKLN